MNERMWMFDDSPTAMQWVVLWQATPVRRVPPRLDVQLLPASSVDKMVFRPTAKHRTAERQVTAASIGVWMGMATLWKVLAPSVDTSTRPAPVPVQPTAMHMDVLGQ